MLRPIPVQLHDCNSKGECRDAKAERVELDVHDGVKSELPLLCCINLLSESCSAISCGVVIVVGVCWEGDSTL